MIKDYKFLEVWIPWDGCIEDIELDGKRYDQFETGETKRFATEWSTLYKSDENEQVWIYLRIDMSDGKVVNWPAGKSGSFDTVKVVDGGKYCISDANNKIIAEYEGYVPDLLAIEEKGYGDYLEFSVDITGKISGWRVNSSLLSNFEENINY